MGARSRVCTDSKEKPIGPKRPRFCVLMRSSQKDRKDDIVHDTTVFDVVPGLLDRVSGSCGSICAPVRSAYADEDVDAVSIRRELDLDLERMARNAYPKTGIIHVVLVN